MSHPDATRDYDEEGMQEIEAEKLWRTLEILQVVRASGCLDEDQLRDLKGFLGLKGDL